MTPWATAGSSAGRLQRRQGMRSLAALGTVQGQLDLHVPPRISAPGRVADLVQVIGNCLQGRAIRTHLVHDRQDRGQLFGRQLGPGLRGRLLPAFAAG
jgi:hypothetical protein